MGILRAIMPGLRSADLAAAAALVAPMSLDLASPWAPTHSLARVLDGQLLTDIFGDGVERPVSRAQAMRVPAVRRARNIICGTVAVLPMRNYRGTRQLSEAEQAPWIAQTDGALPVAHRNAMTADDLLFYGWSCWAVVRGADTVLRGDRIPMGSWSVDDTTGRVKVADRTGTHRDVDQSSVVLFPGLVEGILTDSCGTIRHAADLQHAVGTAARNPAAYLALVQKTGQALKKTSGDPNEYTRDRLIADWAAARRGDNGGVAYLGPGIEPVELGSFSAHMLESARNAAAVDVARITSLPADLLDAAGPASFTYTNSRDNDRRAIQYGVSLYLTPMSAVLSQNHVTPRGQSVGFDLDAWLADPVSDVSASAPSAEEPAAPAGTVTPIRSAR